MIPLPALAALGTGGRLVARRRGVLHLTLPGAPLTPTGRLRRGGRPLCGQRALRWTVAEVDGRRLCHRCARASGTATALPAADRTRLVEALALTLRTAQDRETVQAATLAVIAAPYGVMGALVEGLNGYPVRMTQLVKASREKFDRAATTAADRGWISSVKNAPPSRYPRRVS